MWELFADPTMNNLETMDAILKGYRLPQPRGCPDFIWEIISKCWAEVDYNSKYF
jgi:hypothetical protein